MEDDEKLGLTAEQVAAIAALSEVWFSAIGKDNQETIQEAAHKAADAIRYGVGTVSDVQHDAGYEEYYYAPTPYDIIFTAIAVSQPDMVMHEVRQTANEWTGMVDAARNPSIAIGDYDGFLEDFGSMSMFALGAEVIADVPRPRNEGCRRD